MLRFDLYGIVVDLWMDWYRYVWDCMDGVRGL